MNLHSLKNVAGARHRRKRLGRGHGSGHGKTSGKGHKGQMARAGHKHKEGFEGGQMTLIRRSPKRGFKNPNRTVYAPVNLAMLELTFADGSDVTPEAICAAGLANGPHFEGVKILATGEITKKLNVTAHKFSATAKSKIEAAGGTCTEVGAGNATKDADAAQDDA
ncbi:MAG: 50S ribosomal protein L15 [Verrucomicrobia bacterium]|nr:50S ribosomal protein L15 [Verrucomicrobiota bacterium]MCH8510507.1 50S ribosomal protein L15 [Kiritimatiellia bacterium]